MNLFSRIPTPVRWILLGLSFPIGGLIVFLALGPVTTPVLALAGGAIAGLVIGAAEAFALRVPFVRWTVATAIGLAIGSLVSALIAPLLGAGVLPTVVTALAAGLVAVRRQLARRAAVATPVWLLLNTAAWVVAWVVSLVIAINVTQGFIVFGSSGALVFTLGMFLVVHFAGRSRRTHRRGDRVTLAIALIALPDPVQRVLRGADRALLVPGDPARADRRHPDPVHGRAARG